MWDEEASGGGRTRQMEAVSDEALVLEMRARAGLDAGGKAGRDLWIDARHGVIALTGVVETKEERAVLSVLARTISGCVGVENHLLVRSHPPGVQDAV